MYISWSWDLVSSKSVYNLKGPASPLYKGFHGSVKEIIMMFSSEMFGSVEMLEVLFVDKFFTL